ncbi:MAG: DUF1513 domain-containing protein, partial [Arenicellales bacterium]
PRNVYPPLIALHQRQGNKGLVLLSAPSKTQKELKNYTGSVSFSDDQHFYVSSPRGNMITVWQAEGGYVGAIKQNDASGVASIADKLWASDGNGFLTKYNGLASEKASIEFNTSRWDNHLYSI